MTEESAKPKIKFITTVTCPCCKSLFDLWRKTTILTPAEPAEKEENYYAEKITQKTLSEVLKT